MGEGKGGGERNADIPKPARFPPLYPLPPGEGIIVVGDAVRRVFVISLILLFQP
jgi:hypothetical protein